MISGFITQIEDGIVTIEKSDRTITKVSCNRLPSFFRKGDFIVEDEKTRSFQIDFCITEKRHQEILRMADMLFE